MHRLVPARLVMHGLSILGLVFMGEVTTMYLLPHLGAGLSDGWLALLDASLVCAIVTPPLVAFILVPLWRRHEEQQALAEAREAKLRDEGARQQFEAQLGRALSLVDTESEALDVTRRALMRVLPLTPVELLLADSSEAHLRAAIRVAPEAQRGCSVESPKRCVAARRGQTLRFPDSEAFDACSHLRDRDLGPCSALCVPMSVMGRVVGVIHAFRPAADSALDEHVVPLEAIANQVGTRLGIVRAAATMQVQASTDPLTGLLNRRSFEGAATPLLRAGRPTAVAMADLDHFKRLNDTFGHEAGDRALRTFARTLRTALRANDVVGRLGGEEFAVVLPDCTTEDAVRALEGMRTALITAIARAGVPPFTVSIGVVDASAAEGLDALTSLADKALYEAKRAGRDRIVVAGCGTIEAGDSDRTPRGTPVS